MAVNSIGSSGGSGHPVGRASGVSPKKNLAKTEDKHELVSAALSVGDSVFISEEARETGRKLEALDDVAEKLKESLNIADLASRDGLSDEFRASLGERVSELMGDVDAINEKELNGLLVPWGESKALFAASMDLSGKEEAVRSTGILNAAVRDVESERQNLLGANPKKKIASLGVQNAVADPRIESLSGAEETLSQIRMLGKLADSENISDDFRQRLQSQAEGLFEELDKLAEGGLKDVLAFPFGDDSLPEDTPTTFAGNLSVASREAAARTLDVIYQVSSKVRGESERLAEFSLDVDMETKEFRQDTSEERINQMFQEQVLAFRGVIQASQVETLATGFGSSNGTLAGLIRTIN